MTWLHSALASTATSARLAVSVDAGRDGTLSYGAMFTAACGLDTELGAARSVGVYSNRRPETYIAVLACFLTGRKFVPLNPALPLERLQKIINLAAVDLVVCDAKTVPTCEQLASRWINIAELMQKALGAETATIPELPTVPEADAIAYHLFTSGSTGEPKGVPITYSALSAYVRGLTQRLKLPKAARYSQLFDLSFDLSMHDIFVAFSQGGTLVPASDMNLLMPHTYVDKREIDVWFSVPTLGVAAIRGALAKPTKHKLTAALFCGEPLPVDIATGFGQTLCPEGSVVNLYGPTEATIAFSAHEFSNRDAGGATVPIGLPFGENTFALLMDGTVSEDLQDGAEGELLLSGPQIFSGYFPARETGCFVESSSGTRFYRSGDLVRVEDGNVFHLGRIDDQVKLRGHRMELGEIETVFRSLFDLRNAAAVVLGNGATAKLGLAYEAAADILDSNPAAHKLPDHMMPDYLMRVQRLPVNANGKIDRKALRQLEWPSA